MVRTLRLHTLTHYSARSNPHPHFAVPGGPSIPFARSFTTSAGKRQKPEDGFSIREVQELVRDIANQESDQRAEPATAVERDDAG